MVFGSENKHFKDVNRIDGMPTEFEWKIFPGIRTFCLLEKIRSLMRDLQCKLEDFTDQAKRKMIARKSASIIRNCL